MGWSDRQVAPVAPPSADLGGGPPSQAPLAATALSLPLSAHPLHTAKSQWAQTCYCMHNHMLQCPAATHLDQQILWRQSKSNFRFLAAHLLEKGHTPRPCHKGAWSPFLMLESQWNLDDIAQHNNDIEGSN